MRTVILASAIVGLAALPDAAFADSLGRPCTDKSESDYLSPEALKAKVVEQGYQIRSGEIRKACGEFYVLDNTGKIVAGDGKGETGMSGGGNDNQIIASRADKDRDGDEKGGERKDGDD
jgi:hypothetical protein